MILRVTEYWEMVGSDWVMGWHPVLRGQYQVRASWRLHGYKSLAHFAFTRCRRRKNVTIINTPELRAVRFDDGRQFGIHSYTEITEETP
jgi:hypothetical protein